MFVRRRNDTNLPYKVKCIGNERRSRNYNDPPFRMDRGTNIYSRSVFYKPLDIYKRKDCKRISIDLNCKRRKEKRVEFFFFRHMSSTVFYIIYFDHKSGERKFVLNGYIHFVFFYRTIIRHGHDSLMGNYTDVKRVILCKTNKT